MPRRNPQQAIRSEGPAATSAVKLKRTTGQQLKRARRWTHADDDFIRGHCDAMTDEAMAKELGRSRVGVLLRRINVLQLQKRGALPLWSAEDNAMFEELYGVVDTVFLAAFLSRPVTALWTRGYYLNLQSRGPWSPEEDEIVRQQYPRAPVNEFAHLLPGRSDRNIYHRAGVLGLARGASYLLSSWRMRFHAYPPELQSLIRLHNQVERKLQDVKAQH